MAMSPGVVVKPHVGECAYCGQRVELWHRRCPGNEYHICPRCAMQRYCNGVFECPKEECKRDWSYEERYVLWYECLQDSYFRQYAGDTFRLRENEAWCHKHYGLIGIVAVAPNACPAGQCVICMRCAALRFCKCGYQVNYVPPPDCPGA